MLKTMVTAAGLYVTLGVHPRHHSDPLGEGAKVVGALAAESLRNGTFYGAAAKTRCRVRRAKRTRSGRARDLANVLFSKVSEKRHTP